MNHEETVKVCRLVKALCPSQQIDQFTPDAWAPLLAAWPLADAQAVVYEIAGRPLEPGKSRYIEVGHIIDGIQRIRTKRMQAVTPDPPGGLSAAEYVAWKRATNKAVADGTWTAPAIETTTRPELTAAIAELARPTSDPAAHIAAARQAIRQTGEKQ